MSERSAPRPHRVSHPSAQPCPRAPVPSPPRTSRASSSPRARPATTRSPPRCPPMASPSVRLWMPSPSTTIHARSAAAGLGGKAGPWECPWWGPGGPSGSASTSGAVRRRSSAPAGGEGRTRCDGVGATAPGGGGGLTAWQRGRDPRGRLGGLSVGMGLGGEQSRWAQRDSAVPPRPPGARGSHRGGTATAQHSQQQLQQQQRVDSPQHRQALQHRPQHRRRLLVLPLSLRWVGGSGPCRSVPPAPLPWGYLRGARGAAGRPRRASPPPAPPGRRAERGAARGSAAAPRPRPRPTER